MKQAPQDHGTEMLILGSCLKDPDALETVIHQLRMTDFYTLKHRIIYAAISSIQARQEPVDISTVSNELWKTNPLEAGYGTYLVGCLEEVLTTTNIDAWIKIIQEHAQLRGVINTFEILLDKCHRGQEPAHKLVDEAETAIMEANSGGSVDTFVSVKDSSQEVMDDIERTLKGEKEYLATGYNDLDNLVCGLTSSDLIIIAARPSQGKALCLDSDVLLENGKFRKMEYIKIGDSLASPDGKESIVTGVFPQGICKKYKITFSDRRTIECSGDHLWSIESCRWNNPRVVKTTELIRLLGVVRHKDRIRLSPHNGLFGEIHEIGINPWLLGYLLGDGCLTSSHCVRFSATEDYILDKVREVIPDNHSITTHGGINYRIKGYKQYNLIQRSIKSLGLFGHYSYNKFIPEIVFSAVSAVRYQVLKGLLESDGWVDNSSVQYATASKQLALDTQRLVRSLGGCCRMIVKTNIKYTYKGEQRDGRDSYILSISLRNIGDLVESPRLLKNMTKRRMSCDPIIRRIEESGEAEMQCISVTNKDGLFIVDNYIVTHNTALAVNIAENVAEKFPVGFLSLEMSKEQLTKRMLCTLARVSGRKVDPQFKDGKIHPPELTAEDNAKLLKAKEKLDKLNIYIDDTPALNTQLLRSKAKQLKSRYGIRLLIVDYIQLMEGRGNNRTEGVGEISRGLKILAKELNIPIIALSQLSRGVESRDNKRPLMSDLRDSGEIEQSADEVWTVYRESMYLQHLDPNDPKRLSVEGQAEIGIIKNRDGELGIVHLSFVGEYTRFENLSRRIEH